MRYVCCWYRFLWVLILIVNVTSEHVPQTFVLPEKQRYHLQVVLDAFRDLNLVEYTDGKSTNAINWDVAAKTDKYDLLWSWEYSTFDQIGPLADLKKKVLKVNHIPGSRFLVVKSLIYETQFKLAQVYGKSQFNFIPMQFRIPNEKKAFYEAMKKANSVLQYSDKARLDPNYQKRWLIKSQSHRGVHFFTGQKQEMEQLETSKNEMVSKCLEPFLVSGHKFDIGLYVAVTSISPLRIYVYENILLRFCKLKYPSNLDGTSPVDSYVVNDYLPPWEIEGLRKYYKELPTKEREGTNHFDVLKQYMEEKGFNGRKFQKKVETLITKLIVGTQHHFKFSFEQLKARAANRQKGFKLENFFEMWRFDLMVDDMGTPWLMEVNQSPNLLHKTFPSGTDYAVKYGVVKDLVKMVQFNSRRNNKVVHKSPPSYCASHCENEVEFWDQSCWLCPGWLDKGSATELSEFVGEYARRGKYKLLFPAFKPQEDQHLVKFFRNGMTNSDHLIRRYLWSLSSVSKSEGVDEELICTRRKHCNNQGDCVNGKCRCDSNFEGRTCYIPVSHQKGDNEIDSHQRNKIFQKDSDSVTSRKVIGVKNIPKQHDVGNSPNILMWILSLGLFIAVAVFSYKRIFEPMMHDRSRKYY